MIILWVGLSRICETLTWVDLGQRKWTHDHRRRKLLKVGGQTLPSISLLLPYPFLRTPPRPSPSPFYFSWFPFPSLSMHALANSASGLGSAVSSPVLCSLFWVHPVTTDLSHCYTMQMTKLKQIWLRKLSTSTLFQWQAQGPWQW